MHYIDLLVAGVSGIGLGVFVGPYLVAGLDALEQAWRERGSGGRQRRIVDAAKALGAHTTKCK